MKFKIKDYPNYEIDLDGNVWSIKRGIKLKPYPNKDGYLRVKLYNNKKYEQFFVHLLVFKTVTGIKDLRKKELFIDHINRNINNNSFANLRVVTRSENNKNRKKWAKLKVVIDMPKSKEAMMMDLQSDFFIKEVPNE